MHTSPNPLRYPLCPFFLQIIVTTNSVPVTSPSKRVCTLRSKRDICDFYLIPRTGYDFPLCNGLPDEVLLGFLSTFNLLIRLESLVVPGNRQYHSSSHVTESRLLYLKSSVDEI